MRKIILLISLFSGLNFLNAQTWQTMESLPSTVDTRHHPTTFTIDGIAYLMGGADLSGISMDDFYAYDPTTDSWSTKTDFPGLSRGYSYAVNSETKGYVGFGLNDEGGASTYLFDFWEYDPITDDWTELAPFPGTARIHPALVYLDGKIYVGVGGSSGGDLGDWWEYNIAADTWTEKATFPGPNRHHPYYFGLDGYVYVGMGHSGASIYNDFYRYDPVADSWITLGDLPSQGRVAGTQFAYNGKGYLLSGQGETHENLPTGEFWEYTPSTDSWEELTAHPGGGRWAPGSFVLNGFVYLTCGEANTGTKRDLMRFQIGEFAKLEDENNAFSIYPNPSTGIVVFSVAEPNTELAIFDINGKIVWNAILNSNQKIDLTFLEKGIYVCRLSTKAGVTNKKLILE